MAQSRSTRGLAKSEGPKTEIMREMREAKYSDEPRAVQAEPYPPTGDVIAHVFDRFSVLDEELALLSSELFPVLRSSEPTDVMAPFEGFSGESDTKNSIGFMGYRIQGAIDNIRSLRDRLDV